MIQFDRANIPLTPWVDATLQRSRVPADVSYDIGDMEIGLEALPSLAANDSNNNDLVALRELHLSGVEVPVSYEDVRSVAISLAQVFMNIRETHNIAGSGGVERRLAERYESLMMRGPNQRGDAAEMIETYRFFRTMQHALERLARRHPGTDLVLTSALYVSRVMKWQFRASAHEMIKETLNNAYYARLVSMMPGSSTSWGVSFNVRGEVVPGVGLGLNFGYDAGVEFTPTEWYVESDSRSASLSADAEVLSFLSAHCSAGASSTRADIYASLSDYVASASHKFRAWINEGPIALLGKVRDLFSLSSTYERDLARADFSRPFLDEHLAKIGCRSINIAQRKPMPAPLEQHHTIAGSVDIGASANFFVSANVTASARKFRTTKVVKVDVLELAMSRPNAARSVLRGVTLKQDSKSLFYAMKRHIENSSAEVSLELMSGVKRNAIANMESGARTLLEQLALLKIENKLAPDEETHYMALIDEFERILRPKSLATHEIQSLQDKWQAALGLHVGYGNVLPNGAAVQVTYEKVTRDEDPYNCGSFLDIKVGGAVNFIGGIEEALTLSGVSLESAWDVAHIVDAVKAGDIAYDAGVQTTLRYKLKPEGMALLYATTAAATNYRSTTRAPFAPVSGSVTSTSSSTMVEALTFGGGCLDMLMPIARQRLVESNHGGRSWWTNFTERQRETFDKLFFNLAEGRSDSPLHADFRRIELEVPSTAPLIKTLKVCAQRMALAPTPSHREKAHEALADVFLAYIEGGYKAKVNSEWQHASERKRERDEDDSDTAATPVPQRPRLEPRPFSRRQLAA